MTDHNPRSDESSDSSDTERFENSVNRQSENGVDSSLHIATSSAATPEKDDCKYESVRIETFRSFPRLYPVSPTLLARYGFCYVGYGDEVVCFCCKMRHSHWRSGDDIPAVHARISPDCPIVNGQPSGNIPITSDSGMPTITASIPSDDDMQSSEVSKLRTFHYSEETITKAITKYRKQCVHGPLDLEKLIELTADNTDEKQVFDRRKTRNANREQSGNTHLSTMDSTLVCTAASGQPNTDLTSVQEENPQPRGFLKGPETAQDAQCVPKNMLSDEGEQQVPAGIDIPPHESQPQGQTANQEQETSPSDEHQGGNSTPTLRQQPTEVVASSSGATSRQTETDLTSVQEENPQPRGFLKGPETAQDVQCVPKNMLSDEGEQQVPAGIDIPPHESQPQGQTANRERETSPSDEHQGGNSTPTLRQQPTEVVASSSGATSRQTETDLTSVQEENPQPRGFLKGPETAQDAQCVPKNMLSDEGEKQVPAGIDIPPHESQPPGQTANREQETSPSDEHQGGNSTPTLRQQPTEVVASSSGATSRQTETDLTSVQEENPQPRGFLKGPETTQDAQCVPKNMLSDEGEQQVPAGIDIPPHESQPPGQTANREQETSPSDEHQGGNSTPTLRQQPTEAVASSSGATSRQTETDFNLEDDMRSKAVTILREMGYKDNEIKRAVNEHRQEKGHETALDVYCLLEIIFYEEEEQQVPAALYTPPPVSQPPSQSASREHETSPRDEHQGGNSTPTLRQQPTEAVASSSGATSRQTETAGQPVQQHTPTAVLQSPVFVTSTITPSASTAVPVASSISGELIPADGHTEIAQQLSQGQRPICQTTPPGI